MTTLIGTPPNLIVSGLPRRDRRRHLRHVRLRPGRRRRGLAGVAFVVLIGWRLVPARGSASTEGFETGAYLTEARVPADSKADGMTLREIEKALEEADAQVVGLIRNEVRMTAPNPWRKVREATSSSSRPSRRAGRPRCPASG
jgi:hypothetical protein